MSGLSAVSMAVPNEGSSTALTGESLESREARQYAQRCRREFFYMSMAIGLGHGAGTIPINFASSVLTDASGQASNAMYFGMNLIVSLFASNVVHAAVGAKNGLSISMLTFTVYLGLFALSSKLCLRQDANGSCIEGHSCQLLVALLGAFFGGSASGLLWPCQGIIFSRVAEELAAASATPKEAVTARLSSIFAVIFLGWECVLRALTAVLTGREFHIELSYASAFCVLAVVATLATLLFHTFSRGVIEGKAAPWKFCNKVTAAVRLWRDPTLWLLQLTNLSFGFAVAWSGGYEGRRIISKALSPSFIGFFGALLSGVAAVLSFLIGAVASRWGKGPTLVLSTTALLCGGILSKWVGHPSQWNVGVLIFAVFQGVGRAVYESTNKAILADFFPGDQSPGAFANAFAFFTGASASAFLLGSVNLDIVELYLLLIFAALTLPSYLLAKWRSLR